MPLPHCLNKYLLGSRMQGQASGRIARIPLHFVASQVPYSKVQVLSALPCWYPIAGTCCWCCLEPFIFLLASGDSSMIVESRQKASQGSVAAGLPLSLGSPAGFVLSVSPPKLPPPCLNVPVSAPALKTVCVAATTARLSSLRFFHCQPGPVF